MPTLAESTLRGAKPAEKPYKLFDERGLFMLVTLAGGRDDPGAKRRAESDAKTNTFLAVADEWLLTKKASLTESTWERDRQQVHKWVIPYLGNKPIASLEALDLLEVLKRIEAKGVIDTAHRTREVCGRIFRYAMPTWSERLRPGPRSILRQLPTPQRWDHH
jgi:Phage integrase, N-terminal SAM-like domain